MHRRQGVQQCQHHDQAGLQEMSSHTGIIRGRIIAASPFPRPRVNLLAFDTSTESLSLGVLHARLGQARVLQRQAPGGREASATLIPALMALLAQEGLALADLRAIVFGAGPGSFTGLRTACAVAQGLAFGAGLPVVPIDTLMAVAEQAREAHGATQVTAVLDARMDEVYAARYVHDGACWQRQGPIVLSRPEALQVPAGFVVAGNAHAVYGSRLPAGAGHLEALPTASALLRLAPGLIEAGGAIPADEALPIYVRDKVADTTAEREARRAAATP